MNLPRHDMPFEEVRLNKSRRGALLLAVAVICCGSAPARADEAPQLKLSIRDHKFLPAGLSVAAGQRFEILVTNDGPGPEEFESKSLRIEKLVPEGQTVTIRVGPLKSGQYDFFGDFHKDTCVGQLSVP